MLIPRCCKNCSNRNQGVCNCTLPMYCNEYVEVDNIQKTTMVDLLNRETDALYVAQLQQENAKLKEEIEQLKKSKIYKATIGTDANNEIDITNSMYVKDDIKEERHKVCEEIREYLNAHCDYCNYGVFYISQKKLNKLLDKIERGEE